MTGTHDNIERNSIASGDWPAGGLKVTHLVMSLNVGGAERLLADTLPVFSAADYKMKVMALGKDGPMGEIIRKRGIPVEVLNGAPSRPGFLYKLFRRLSSDPPDILHTHLYWPGVLGRIAGKLAGIEAIVCHEHFMPKEISAWRRIIERPTWNWADAVVCISRAVFEGRADSLPQKVVSRVILNGICLDEISTGGSPDLRNIISASDNAFIVGWVGRLDESAKNLTVLINAAGILAKENPGIRWALIGDGPDRESLKRKIRKLGLDDKIYLLGERLDVRKLYCGMDLFVMPSRFEGLGIVILEAMAAGLPVVASSAGGIPEVVVDGETGLLFEPEDCEGMAEKILRLVGDPAKRRAMGAGGRRRVGENFSVSAYVQSMDRFYRAIWSGED